MAKIPRDVLYIATLLALCSASFALGVLAGREGEPGAPAATSGQENLDDEATSATGRFVASKNGTKYYLPECTGADRISESNKVWFATAAAAVSAGYAPAANCKGL